MRKLVVIIFLIVSGFYSFSQIKWINYLNSGHYHDAFTAIEFDGDNNPWVGTMLNGLHHFKGTFYQSYNTSNSAIPHDKIYDLLYSSDDQLWIATFNGLALFKENIWTNYTTENSNLPSDIVYSLAKGEGGRIWIGTDRGVVDGLNGIVYNSQNTPLKGEIFYHILTDSKGNIWFCTNQEVAKFDGENWQVFSNENSILPAEIAIFIEEDAFGTFWVSLGNTYAGTLAAYDGNLWKIFDKSFLYNLTSRISSIVKFNDGTNWFGTHDKGLIRYKDSVWTGFSTDNSEIPINQIICMKADRENNLWLGHRNGLTKVQTETVVGVSNVQAIELIITPNPMNERATINVPKLTNNSFVLVVSNIKGQIIRRHKNITNDFIFEKKGLDSGIYLLKLYNSNEVYYRKILIK